MATGSARTAKRQHEALSPTSSSKAPQDRTRGAFWIHGGRVRDYQAPGVTLPTVNNQHKSPYPFAVDVVLSIAEASSYHPGSSPTSCLAVARKSNCTANTVKGRPTVHACEFVTTHAIFVAPYGRLLNMCEAASHRALDA